MMSFFKMIFLNRGYGRLMNSNKGGYMDFVEEEKLKFWKDVYIASVREGNTTPCLVADAAIKELGNRLKVKDE